MHLVRIQRALLVFFAAILFAAVVNAQEASKCSPGFIWDKKSEKCVSCVRPCQTGLPGVCGRGIMNCDVSPPVCDVIVKVGERMEVCNGEDDDCDKQIDEGYDKDQDGYTTCGGDCNDRDAGTHPDVAELCDGRDNNCNGIIDDGFGVGSPCTVGRGICARQGKRYCSPDDSGVLCDAKPGEPQKEVCDGLDNDCDGMVDNGLGEITCGKGACLVTVAACVKGKLNKCKPLDPGIELCGDRVDNDCDGAVDEDFLELGKSCSVGKGICTRTGEWVCQTDKKSLVCNVEAGKPTAEICGNRLDDDCNGIVDDVKGINDQCDNGQVGECYRKGILVCNAAKGIVECSASRVEPQEEICDQKDNDCDGQIDEGVQNACGTCGDLPAKIADRCLIDPLDSCSVGQWECDAKRPGKLVCSPRFNVSENRLCDDDGNSCTKDVCREGKCGHLALEDGTKCSDEDECTLADHCIKGECKGGAFLTCDDLNPCTIDKCDSKMGCLYDEIGGGIPNVCGGCEVLGVKEGDKCMISSLSGVCSNGEYRCAPDNQMACVQKYFAGEEYCNDLDDDCDGVVDEDLGTISCGIGSCHVTMDRCVKGKIQSCTPAQAAVETCDNMGSDNDCNGVVDDIIGLNTNCPVKIGTCIIPGTYQCMKGSAKPVCAASSETQAKDDDGNGIPNYCETEGLRVASSQPGKGSVYLFDTMKTRAAMLPWMEVYDSLVTSSNPQEAWLLVSGKNAMNRGIAAIPAREIFKKGPVTFRVCSISNAPYLKNLVITSGNSFFATTGNQYYKLPSFGSDIPSFSMSACQWKADTIIADDTRTWTSGKPGKEKICLIKDIMGVASLPHSEDLFAGAVSCEISQSSSKKTSFGLGLDIISFSKKGTVQQFIPLWESSRQINNMTLLPAILKDSKTSFAVIAYVDDETKTAMCRMKGEEWECVQNTLGDIDKPLIPLARKNSDGPVLLSSTDGSIYELSFSEANLTVKQKGAVKDGKDRVIDGISFPVREGGVIALGQDYTLTVVLPDSSSEQFWSTKHAQSYVPESSIDEVSSAGEVNFVSPHAMTLIPTKEYGGMDLFTVFDILGGGKKIGTMGFFFWNDNKAPYGNIADISFDGRSGKAKLKMTDPDGDKIMYDVHIRAKHGGSLDHWIDGIQNGVVSFSPKGETASTLGVWPVKLMVEALDPEGRGVISIAMIAHDGTVESIQELAR